MITVPEAARMVGRNPETVRRWIREGKLPAHKIGTQHVIDEGDLGRLMKARGAAARRPPFPAATGVDPVAAVRRSRAERSARLAEVIAPYLTERAGWHPEANDPLPAIVGRLVRLVDPVRIVLFGSRARGSASPDSDYDLLVVLDEAPARRETRSRIRRTLEDLPVSFDLIVAGRSELSDRKGRPRGIVQWAAQEGRVVYERP